MPIKATHARTRANHAWRSLLAATALAWAGTAPAASPPSATQALHRSLLTLDTHLDTPALFSVAGWSILDRHDVAKDGSQIDLPRMLEGGLDGGFWATYTSQGPLTDAGRAAARDAALLRLQEIHELVAAHADRFELAYTADDAARIAASRRRIVYLSMENGYPIGTDLTLLATFYKLGVRVMGPVHFANNDLGDSSTDPAGPRWHGLSPLGRQYVQEANRLGILLDASHASDEVLDQLIELSATPIVLTHSGARAVFDHPRNVDDRHLRALAASGGVIQVSAYSDYMIVKSQDPARAAAIAEVRRAAAGRRSQVQREATRAALLEVDRRYPQPRATFEDYIAHLRHAIAVAGIDHVGIGIDFDGGGGVTGLDQASDYPRITARLLELGLGRDDLQKLWSGNVLRVLRQAQEGKREGDRE
jgi:membrane dipeptidase